jgi:hypothetical protein
VTAWNGIERILLVLVVLREWAQCDVRKRTCTEGKFDEKDKKKEVGSGSKEGYAATKQRRKQNQHEETRSKRCG